MRQLLLAAVVLAAACDNRGTPPATTASGSAGSAAAGPGAVGGAGAAGSADGAGSAGSTAGGGAGSGSSADPWNAPPAPREPDTPELRRKRAEAALARVATIKPVVEKLRSLRFQHDVPTRYQPTAEFQEVVRRELAKELPPERSRALSAALAHLGFLTRPVDLAAVQEQAMITQAGAYYDPAVKSFFLVMVPDGDILLDTMSAHELTHALQDQRFDLARYLPSDRSVDSRGAPTGRAGEGRRDPLDDDAIAARRFVVEGDATFVMLLYGVRGVTGDELTPQVVALLRAQVEKLAALDIDGLKAMTRDQSGAFGMMDADIKKAIDAMDQIPPAVLVPLLDAYMKGALVALTAYEHGGWAAVDQLYGRPPESTEQVLHPSTKLVPVRERPRRVTLAKSTDPELVGNVLGELQWKIYFEQWKVPGAAEAAAGWGGDRYSVTRRTDGRLVGRIATTWDTARDAEAFAAAYVASLAARFLGADTSRPAAGVARPDGTQVLIRTTGKHVYIVDGADAPAELDALVRATRFP